MSERQPDLLQNLLGYVQHALFQNNAQTGLLRSQTDGSVSAQVVSRDVSMIVLSPDCKLMTVQDPP